MKHEQSGERLIDQETGKVVTENMQPRQPVRYIRNGSRMSSSWLITIKNGQLLIGVLLSLGTLAGMGYAATEILVKPSLRETIRTEMAPLALEVSTNEKAFQAHLQDAAVRYGDVPRRDELARSIDDLRAEIRLLRQEMKR